MSHRWLGVINSFIKSTVKLNLSFEYGNIILKVGLNRFCSRLNHIHGIHRTLSSIQYTLLFYLTM